MQLMREGGNRMEAAGGFQPDSMDGAETHVADDAGEVLEASAGIEPAYTDLQAAPARSQTYPDVAKSTSQRRAPAG